MLAQIRTVALLTILFFLVTVTSSLCQQPCPGPIFSPYPASGPGYTNLHIRTGPSLSYSIIDKLNPQRRLMAHDEQPDLVSGAWFKVHIPTDRYGTTPTTAWISNYMALDNSVGQYFTVNSVTGGLNVRPSAGSTANVVYTPIGGSGSNAKVWSGQSFPVTGSQNVAGQVWYRFDLTDNCSQPSGWVHGGYVTVSNFNSSSCLGSRPDIVVEDIWTDPAVPIQNQPFQLYVQIRNVGNATASSIEWDYKIDGLYECGDSHGSLDDGDVRVESCTYTHTSSGCFNYSVVVDPVAFEVVTTNNDRTEQVCVSPCSAPAIGTQPSGGTYCVGDNFATSISASSTSSLNFQWFKNGSSIPGETSSVLNLGALALSEAGLYYCRASNICGSTNSNTFSITVNSCSPSVDFVGTPITIIEDQNVGFVSQISGPFTSVQWNFDGGTPSTSTSNNPSNIVYKTPGCYRVTLTAYDGSSSLSEVKSCYITVLPDYGHPIPEDMSIADGFPTKLVFDPINAATGAYYWTSSELAIPSPFKEFEFKIYYKSCRNTIDGEMGFGWSHNWMSEIDKTDSLMTLTFGDGHRQYYVPYPDGTVLPRYAGTLDSLVILPDSSIDLLRKGGERWHYTSTGNLFSVTDRKGNVTNLTYNLGRVVSIQNGFGRLLSIGYGPSGRVATVSDQLQRTVSYQYGTSGDLVTSVAVNGGVISYVYDNVHRLLEVFDPKGSRVVSNIYDGSGQVVKQFNAIGDSVTLQYNSPTLGQTTTIDESGMSMIIEHDSNFRITKERDAQGNEYLKSYDINHSEASFTDENGATFSYTNNGMGEPITIVDPNNGTTNFTFNQFGDLESYRNAQNYTTYLTYDSAGNVLDIHYPDNSHRTATYDGTGLLATLVDGNGNMITYQYDTGGNLSNLVDGDGIHRFVHDTIGRLVSDINPDGDTAFYSYDNHGKLIQEVNYIGNLVRRSYDLNGNLDSLWDAESNLTVFQYDLLDRLTAVVFPDSSIYRQQYTKSGAIKRTIDENGNATDYSFNTVGRLASISSGTNVLNITYDAAGNITMISNANGEFNLTGYNQLGQVTSTTNALGQTTYYVRDAMGQIAQTIAPGGIVTTYQYDELGRLSQVTDANSQTAQYTRDFNGNITRIRNPKGGFIDITYDHKNRVMSKRDASYRTERWTYNSSGFVLNHAGFDQDSILMQHDALGNLRKITYSNGDSTGFRYDRNQNLIAVMSGQDSIHYEFDSRNRKTSVTDQFQNVTRFEFDLVGNQTGIIYPSGDTVKYQYGTNRELISVVDWLGDSIIYEYDNSIRSQSISNANGTRTQIIRDSLGRITGYHNLGLASDTISSVSVVFDPRGFVNERVREPEPGMQLPFGVRNMLHEANDVLSLGTNQVYTNNVNGQRINESGTLGSKGYSYGLDGAVTGINIAGQAITFGNDLLGNRISRLAGGQTVRYSLAMIDGMQQVLEERDSLGVLVHSYIYGLGLSKRIDSAGNSLYYHFDEIGHTSAITDSSGTIVASYDYLPFGELMSEIGPAVDQPFKFLGKFGVTAEGGGLYHARNRIYDSNSGRFVSQDPFPWNLGNPQTLNRYSYVVNNPLQFIDPLGLYHQGVEEPAFCKRRRLIEVGCVTVTVVCSGAALLITGGLALPGCAELGASCFLYSAGDYLNQISKKDEVTWADARDGALVIGGKIPGVDIVAGLADSAIPDGKCQTIWQKARGFLEDLGESIYLLSPDVRFRHSPFYYQNK